MTDERTYSPEEEEAHKRKIITWLALGSLGLALVIGGIIALSSFLDEKEAEAEKVTLAESELNGAQVYAEEFIEKSATFGVSPTVVDSDTMNYAKTLVSENNGDYTNTGFGMSRKENYTSNIAPKLDPDSRLDGSLQFIDRLNEYYPDWTGQLASYNAEDVKATVGEPYVSDLGKTLVPLQVSFNSHMILAKDSDIQKTDGSWEKYEGNEFINLDVVLSQAGSSWQVWDVNYEGEYPFVLGTWQEPDWKSYPFDSNSLVPMSDE